jgi:hypothetical protein
MVSMNRWYDSNRKLKLYLESLHDMEGPLCEKIVKDLMALIREYDGALLDRFAEEYPLESRKQRWYDQNPYLWILFNGLQYASEEILDLVIEYFEGVL